MNTPNENRLITIEARNEKGDFRDWRHALERLSSKNGETYSILDNNLLRDTVVDSRVCLLMSSPPKTMKTSNKFTTPVENLLKSGKSNSSGVVGKIANVLTMGYNASNALFFEEGSTSATWQPWMTGVKAWDGSRGGFSFDYEFSFAMGQYGLWNAKEEVVKPILNLIAPALPRSLNNFSMNGPFPTAIQLLSLMVREGLGELGEWAGEGVSQLADYFRGGNQTDTVANQEERGSLGNDLYSAASNGDALLFFNTLVEGSTQTVNGVLTKLSNTLNNLIQEAYKNYTYDIKFGNFITFNNMIITNGETSFSNEVDQKGYPIAGTVKLSFEGLVPLAMTYANTDLVAIKYGYGGNQE